MLDQKRRRLQVETKRLDGVIYDDLRARIVSLHYRPGEMISENEISSEYGVSRTPVSRAFVRLAHEGLIEIQPQRGAQVSFLSKQNVYEAQNVRECLEISAFSEVAAKWTSDDDRYKEADKKIKKVIEAQKKVIELNDYISFTKLDEDYHSTILQLAGNMTLFRVVEEMRATLNRVRYIELQEAHHGPPAIIHHEEIWDAICRNNVAHTQEKLRLHLRMLEPLRETLFEKHRDLFV